MDRSCRPRWGLKDFRWFEEWPIRRSSSSVHIYQPTNRRKRQSLGRPRIWRWRSELAYGCPIRKFPKHECVKTVSQNTVVAKIAFRVIWRVVAVEAGELRSPCSLFTFLLLCVSPSYACLLRSGSPCYLFSIIVTSYSRARCSAAESALRQTGLTSLDWLPIGSGDRSASTAVAFTIHTCRVFNNKLDSKMSRWITKDETTEW